MAMPIITLAAVTGLPERHARRDGRPADADARGVRPARPGRASWTGGAACGRPGRPRWSAASCSRVAQFATSNYLSVAADRHRRLAARRRRGRAAAARVAPDRYVEDPSGRRGTRPGRRCAVGGRRRRRDPAPARRPGRHRHRRGRRPGPRRRTADDRVRCSRPTRRTSIIIVVFVHRPDPGGQGPARRRRPMTFALARPGRLQTPRASRSTHRHVQAQLAHRGRHPAAHRRAASPCRADRHLGRGGRRAPTATTLPPAALGDRHRDGGARAWPT